MRNTAEQLGIDADKLTLKCAKFSKEFIKEVMSDENENPQKMIDYLKGSFTEEEIHFIAFSWLAEKTESVLTGFFDFMKKSK